jgi:solute carrier family 25 S-adenosylmethionine transporter 26
MNLLPFTHSLPTPVVHAIASSVAECVSCFILTPAEVLKQNAQMHGDPQRNASMRVLSHFRRRPLQLWSGYGALVARNLPFTAMQFPLFEHLRETMVRWRKLRLAAAGKQYKSETGDMVERAGITAISAGLAGSVAAIITTPIDVVKTRIMLAAGERDDQRSSAAARKSRPGMFSVGRDIYRQEGFMGLFKGGALRSGWTALGLGLYLSAYESGRLYLEQRRKNMAKGSTLSNQTKQDGDAVF